MSRGPYPVLLLLAMALPGTVRALGLGEIRVDSALNEPLSAQIEIVGATRDELIALTAKVANREIFQRYGADRPAFLSSATFKVGLDAQGRPVLNVKSAEAFTDPLIDFLVELRWDKNQVIREYSLLLDPPGLTAHPQASEVALASAGPAAPSSPLVSRATTAPPPAGDRLKDLRPAVPAQTGFDTMPGGLTQYRVAAGDTLRGVARRTGARSEAEIQRMLIAVFRANPSAFEGNINRLHVGALLTIPTADAVAAISNADAKREVRAQMTAWRLDGRLGAPHRVAGMAGASPAPAAPVSHANPTVAGVPASVAPAPALPLSHAAAATTVSAAPPASHAAAAPAPALPASHPAAAAPIATAATAQAAQAPQASPTPMAMQPAGAQDAVPDAELKARVQSLEHALADMHKQLAGENAKIQDLTEEAARAAPSTAAPVRVGRPADVSVSEASRPTLAAVASTGAMGGKGMLAPMAVALAFLAGGFAYMRRRLSRPPAEADNATPADVHPTETLAAVPTAAEASPVAKTAPPAAPRLESAAARPVVQPPKPEPAIPTPRQVGPNETTVSLAIDTEALERSYLDSLGMDTALDTVAIDASELEMAVAKADLNTVVIDTKGIDSAALDGAALDSAALSSAVLDYDLLDLDATAQHVHMPSGLHEQPVVTERRTSIVDALKMAIERDPHRRDLSMKLLETYYGLAATNQRAFMDVVRKLARERDYLSKEDWNKVVMMGKEIAPDDILFAGDAKDDLANCA